MASVYAEPMTIRYPKALLIVLCAVLALGAFEQTATALDKSKIDGDFMGTVSVPAGFSLDEVRNTVALALADRTWQIKAKEHDHVIGYLNHRRREVTLTIVFDTNEISIYSDGWTLTKTGERKKPDPAAGWVANITKDLNKMLGVAAATK